MGHNRAPWLQQTLRQTSTSAALAGKTSAKCGLGVTETPVNLASIWMCSMIEAAS